MSQQALADVSRVERSYISMIENGHRDPSYDVVKALAGAIGVPPSTMYRAAEMDSPRPEDDQPETIVRVNDPALAAALRRIARWGAEKVTRLERVGREMYEGQMEGFVEAADALPDDDPAPGPSLGGLQGAGC
jgi:transcriptional regulator with XRE-family HTH domain